jgi:hypothetical protein
VIRGKRRVEQKIAKNAKAGDVGDVGDLSFVGLAKE